MVATSVRVWRSTTMNRAPGRRDAAWPVGTPGARLATAQTSICPKPAGMAGAVVAVGTVVEVTIRDGVGEGDGGESLGDGMTEGAGEDDVSGDGDTGMTVAVVSVDGAGDIVVVDPEGLGEASPDATTLGGGVTSARTGLMTNVSTRQDAA